MLGTIVPVNEFVIEKKYGCLLISLVIITSSTCISEYFSPIVIVPVYKYSGVLIKIIIGRKK